MAETYHEWRGSGEPDIPSSVPIETEYEVIEFDGWCCGHDCDVDRPPRQYHHHLEGDPLYPDLPAFARRQVSPPLAVANHPRAGWLITLPVFCLTDEQIEELDIDSEDDND